MYIYRRDNGTALSSRENPYIRMFLIFTGTMQCIVRTIVYISTKTYIYVRFFLFANICGNNYTTFIMHIPFFTLQNYSSIMSRPYEEQDRSSRIDIWDFFEVFQHDFIERFAEIDARKLWAYLISHQLTWTCEMWNVQCDLDDGLVACKLMCPTLHQCQYFSWKWWHGEHVGIDIILPKNTPIWSFCDGEVVRVKHRDGNPTNEWNTVVVRTKDNFFFCYEHLERIDVKEQRTVKQGDIIWLCWSTWHSTQYHLHLQIDNDSAPFHPYWHTDKVYMSSYTENPLPYLHALSPKRIFEDLPSDPEQQQAILSLQKQWILKWYNNRVNPDWMLKRYEMALLIDRILDMYALYGKLPVQNNDYISYADTPTDDAELLSSLERLQTYWVMKWYSRWWSLQFSPYTELTWAQLLAILWRTFYALEDTITSNWWQNYLDVFLHKWLISSSREYIHSSIPRKEVAVVLWKVLDSEWLFS